MQDADFGSQLAKALKISGLILALLCLILTIRPGDPIVWGLVIGIAAGMASAFFLGKRVKQAEKAGIERGKIQIVVGVFLRLIFIIAVLYVVNRIEWISLIATALGIFVVHGVFTVMTMRSGGVSGEDSL